MRAKDIPINLRAADTTPGNVYAALTPPSKFAKDEYQRRFAYLEDQTRITPTEKLNLLINGLRNRNRLGKFLLSGWESRAFYYDPKDQKKVTDFFATNPQYSPAEILNIMQLCDDRADSFSNRSPGYFTLKKAKNVGWLIGNIRRVTTILKYLRLENDAPIADYESGTCQVPDGPHEFFYPIKRTYIALRWFKQPLYDPGNLFDYDFNQAAIIAASMNVNPHRFIEVQFDLHGDRDNISFPPSPAYLHRGKALWTSHEVIQRQPKTKGELEFDQEIRSLNYDYQPGDNRSVDERLQDKWVQVKAYTRIILCSEAILSEMQEAYGDAARRYVTAVPSLEDHLWSRYCSRFNRLSIPDNGRANWRYRECQANSPASRSSRNPNALSR